LPELKQLRNRMVAHARASEVLTHRLFADAVPRFSALLTDALRMSLLAVFGTAGRAIRATAQVVAMSPPTDPWTVAAFARAGRNAVVMSPMMPMPARVIMAMA
jgi:hypothetical protein